MTLQSRRRGQRQSKKRELGLISYRAGFVAFLAVTVVRALVNGYRINVMPIAAAERLPLRQP